LNPIRSHLTTSGFTFTELKYGSYRPERYHLLLQQCRGMIFLCEHESQGIAYQECLASGIPIIAWDQGQCLDPNRFTWGTPFIPASSVPYWDARCGVRFSDYSEFSDALASFEERFLGNTFNPREYILENLTLEKCASRFLSFL
jgi:glycosyltransferase involved in cell wall biosynthesis